MRATLTAEAALASFAVLVTPAGAQTSAPTAPPEPEPAPAPAPEPAPVPEPAPATPSTETPAPAPTPTPEPAPQPAAKPPVNANAALATGALQVQRGRFRYANTWNLDLEGGAGYVFSDVDKWTTFFRARPGVLIVRDDDFYQLGATAEYMGLLRRPAFGLQAEYLHLQLGTWIQVGGSIDTKGRPGVMGAVGLSIFGVEAQVRELDQVSGPAFALIGKVRVPIGILVYGLRTRK